MNIYNKTDHKTDDKYEDDKYEDFLEFVAKLEKFDINCKSVCSKEFSDTLKKFHITNTTTSSLFIRPFFMSEYKTT